VYYLQCRIYHLKVITITRDIVVVART